MAGGAGLKTSSSLIREWVRAQENLLTVVPSVFPHSGSSPLSSRSILEAFASLILIEEQLSRMRATWAGWV